MTYATVAPCAVSLDLGRAVHMPAIPGYRLQRRIGQGRMCAAYLAHDPVRGGEVALKVFPQAHANDAVRKHSFVQEFRIPFLVRNRHVVRVFDQIIGESYSFIAMEYVEGGDLAGAIRRGLTVRDAMSLLRQAAVALAEIHRRGFVHCDVKPENMLLRGGGELVLADFGLARRVGTVSAAAPGSVLGTPCYAAPEQAQGGAAAPAADVYSLGIVFYEMLCGVPPFAGLTPMEVHCQHLVAGVPKMRRGLAALQPLIDSMLEKQATRRPQDGDAVLHQIDLMRRPAAAIAKS